MTTVPQPMAIFNELKNFAQTLVIFTPRIFFVLSTLTGIYSSCEILRSRIKLKSFVETDRLTNYLRKVMPERISDIEIGFNIS